MTKEYQFESFEDEWRFTRPTDTPSSFFLKNTLKRLRLQKEYLPAKWVLDAGCGQGLRTKPLAHHGAHVVLFDVTEQALLQARENLPSSAYCIRGDVCKPPFKDNTFDVIFSNGVLPAMPNPQEGFFAMTTLLRNGGYIYVFVYRKLLPPLEFINSALRAITTRLPRKMLFFLCKLYEHTGVFLCRIIGREINHFWIGKDINTAWFLFDWLSPRYQHHFSIKTLQKSYLNAGLKIIYARVHDKLNIEALGQK